MKKQLYFAIAGLLLVVVLFIFGKTYESKKPAAGKPSTPEAPQFDVEKFISASREKLKPSSQLYLSKLEHGITRGDVPAQQKIAYQSLAAFWKDSAHQFEPYAFYISKFSKLDNSEKNLTFAAQLFLDALRSEHDESKIKWESDEAISLFEKALVLDPENDDLRIGLGSCYVFGKGRNGDPQQTMTGIQELLKVVRKDSNNMKAQMVLGIGGYVSGQYDKAVDRLKKVVEREPNNLEAIAFLADTYAAKGDKPNAVKWYELSKKMANNPAYSKEVDERIKMLR